MKYSFFSPKTQFENVGDVLIYREMIRLAANNSIVRVDSSRCPDSFDASLALNSIKNVSYTAGGFPSLLREMLALRFKKHDCYYYLSPGGYFGEVEGFEIIRRYVNFLILLVMKVFGIKIVHVGVSYERLGPKFLRLIALRSRFLYRHILRDNSSAIYAEKNRIRYHGVSPDLAFNLYSDIKTSVKANKVCFSFRTDQDPMQWARVKELVEACNEYLDPCLEFVFYAQVERDKEPMERLATELQQQGGERKVSFISIMGEVDKSVEFFRDVEIIISNRLHVLLMGGVYNATIIAATFKGYNEKVVGLMESTVSDNPAIIDMSLETKPQLDRVTAAKFKFSTHGKGENDSLVTAFGEIYA